MTDTDQIYATLKFNGQYYTVCWARRGPRRYHDATYTMKDQRPHFLSPQADEVYVRRKLRKYHFGLNVPLAMKLRFGG